MRKLLFLNILGLISCVTAEESGLSKVADLRRSLADAKFCNSTLGVCQTCTYGQYYDFTFEVCRDCSGKCTGLCNYQSSCMDCAPTESLDLDSLSCVSDCGVNQIKIQDSQFSVPSVCRGFNYYVDPGTSENLEVGSQRYPFQNLKAVISEIINYFSHTDKAVTIYLKENSNVYLEDKIAVLLNITSVTIKSYSDVISSPSRATLIGTKIAQIGINPNVSFSIHQSSEIRTTQKISEGNLTATEKIYIGALDVTVTVVRTSLYLYNLNIIREIVDYELNTLFFQFLYLQEKWFDAESVTYNVTGSLIQANDPMSIRIEDVLVDAYALRDGYMIYTICNYPEAYLKGQAVINNFKVITSTDRKFIENPSVLYYGGASNTTATNMDFTDAYVTTLNPKAQFMVTVNPTCTPDDGLVQLVEVHNSSYSLPSNPDGSKGVLVNFLFNQNLYREIRINTTNQRFDQVVRGPSPLILMYGTYLIDIYCSDFYLNDFSSIFPTVQLTIFRQAVMNRITFKRIPDYHDQPTILAQGVLSFSLNEVSYEGVNGTLSTQNPLITLQNIPTTYTSISGIKVVDSILKNRKILQSINSLQTLTIKNGEYSNCQQSSGGVLFSTGVIGELVFQNHTFTGMSSTESSDTTSKILEVSQIDLNYGKNSTIENVSVSNSTIGMIGFNGIINSGSDQILTMKNCTYFNSTIDAIKSLIITKNLLLNQNFTIYLENATFTNIEFTNRGYLLDLNHQLASQFVIKDSNFYDLRSSLIRVESGNQNNKVLSTRVLIQNTPFININSKYNSFININEGGILEVTGSNFTHLMTYEEGAIVFAGSQRTTTIFENCTFTNNYAQTGALFYIESQSVVKCNKCYIFNNFAISSTVLDTQNNGYFVITESEIYENYAVNIPVAKLFDTALASEIHSTKIHHNYALTVDVIKSETTETCELLCFLPELFKTMVLTDSNFAKYTYSMEILQLISASLIVNSSTEIYEENVLFNVFLSSLSLENIVLRDITLISEGVQVVSSTLEMSNITIRNISNPVNTEFIFGLLESTIVINSVNFSNSSSIFLNVRNSRLRIDTLNLLNITSATSLVLISTLQEASLKSVTISNSTAGNSELLRIYSTVNLTSDRVVINGIKQNCLTIISSVSSSLSGLDLKGCEKALTVSRSNLTIIGSVLNDNGDTTVIQGAGIYSSNSELNIQTSEFKNNTAIRGGAIKFSCTSLDLCGLVFKNNQCINNTAVQEGGCLNYDFRRPTFENITHEGNQAPYGPYVASYPVKIKLQGSSTNDIILNNAGSGILYDHILNLALMDYDDQVMVLNDVNQILITAVNSTVSSIEGFNGALLKKGVATFDNIIAVSSPGAKDIKYQANCKIIDKSLINQVFGSQISENLITVNFRHCKPGEQIFSQTRCQECSAGTYSLLWNSTKCETCLDNVVCLGKQELVLNPGYWRRTTNSTKIMKCPNLDACKGGYFAENEHPVECEAGYVGNLCAECSMKDPKYVSAGSFLCEKCPDPVLNAIRVIGVGFLVFFFFILLIIINVRKTKESELSVLFRILTNYLQLLTTSVTFSADFPSTLNDLTYPMQKVGSSSESFLSFDCFARDSNLTGPFPSTVFLKLFLSAFLPIILFLFISCIWIILRLIRRKFIPSMERYLVITFISILFLLHPKLTGDSLTVFQCIEIDEGMQVSVFDTNIDCYSYEHLKWSIALAVPILVVWVFGVPIIGLILLARSFKNEESKISKYFLILYQGLQRKHFYWEFFNSFRKMTTLLIFAFLGRFNIFAAVILLIITFRLQVYIKPYKEPAYNEIEILAILAGMVTISSGVIFEEEEPEDTINFFIFLLLIAFNLKFILEWLYLLLLSFSKKYKFLKKIVVLFELVLFKKKSANSQYVSTAKGRKKTGGRRKKLRKSAKKLKKKKQRIRRRLRKARQEQETMEKEKENDTKRKLLDLAPDVIIEEQEEASAVRRLTKQARGYTEEDKDDYDVILCKNFDPLSSVGLSSVKEMSLKELKHIPSSPLKKGRQRIISKRERFNLFGDSDSSQDQNHLKQFRLDKFKKNNNLTPVNPPPKNKFVNIQDSTPNPHLLYNSDLSPTSSHPQNPFTKDVSPYLQPAQTPLAPRVPPKLGQKKSNTSEVVYEFESRDLAELIKRVKKDARRGED